MKNLFFALLFSLGFTSAHAALNGTVCKGERVQWEDISHMTGAGIGPNGIVSHTQLSIDGALAERIEYSLITQVEVDPVFSVSFDESTEKEITAKGTPVSGSRVYDVVVTLKRHDGTNVVSGWLSVSTRVRCETHWAMLP